MNNDANEEVINRLTMLIASLKLIKLKVTLDVVELSSTPDSFKLLDESLNELEMSVDKAIKECRKVMIQKLQESVK